MPRVQVPEYKTFVDFPDDMAPEQIQTVLAQNFPRKHGIVDAVKGAAASAAAGVNEANAGFFSTLNKGAKLVERLTGLRAGGAFEAGERGAREGAQYWREKAADAGMGGDTLPAKVYSGIGSAPMGIAEFVAGTPYAAVKGAVESPGEGVKAGLERFAVGKVFKGLEKANLTPTQRSGAMAGTMAAQTAAEGGDVEDVVASGLTGLALSLPSETGARSVVRQRAQAAGTSPEIAMDLAGRSGGVEPQGPGYIEPQGLDVMYPTGRPVRPAINNSEQMPPTESFRRPAEGPVLDAENPSRISPYDAIGPSPGISIEVARLKQEHPFWSEAEYLNEAQRRVLTHNPEVLPAATDASFVRPVAPEPVRQAEDAPGLRRGVAIGDQEMGQRFGTSDRIADPANAAVLNPEVLPARTDADRYAAPSAPAERPAEQSPSRTVEPVSMENFNHDSLSTAAVTAADSLQLQQVAPQLKVAVVGTPAEIASLREAGQTKGKVVYPAGDRAYVIDPVEAKKQFGSLDEAKRMLRAGGDAEARVLGYPERPAGEPLQTAAVTKTGEILTEPEAIKQAASAGEVAYAAEGRPEDVAAKTEPVAEALAPAGREGGGALEEKGRRQEVLTGQVDLHAGVHLPTLVKQVYDHYFRKLDTTAAPGSVKEWQNKNEEANRKYGKEPILNAIRRATIDQSANAQNELVRFGPDGRWVKDELNAVSGATGISALRRERVRNDILHGTSLRERQAFERIIPIDRDLAIADYKYKVPTSDPSEVYTYTGGFSPAELQAARKSFQADYKLSDAEMQRADQSVKRYFEAYKENTQRMLDAGLITPEQKVELDSHPYSPKQFLEKIDPTGYGQSGPYSVPESGIPRLKQGSDGYYRSDPMRLLEESIDRVETRIARNNANKALAQLPAGNKIVEPAKQIGVDKWAKAPSGFEQISYMDGGRRKVINVREDFAREWRQNDPLVGSLLVDVAGWVSGATPVRAASTGHNPAFALVNLPVDTLTIWMQADKRGYSPIAPVAAAQVARNLIKVAPDAWKHVGRYEDWVMQYGARDMLSQYGSLTSRRKYLSPALQKISDVTSKIGRFSEEVSRLAYREQLIKNGVDPAAASKQAAEYIDFSRGGTVIKAVDRLGLPYLNAGLQGFRSMARSSTRDPAMFALKSAQLLLGASILYGYNSSMNPEGWANVSDKDKAENFIIMAPSYFNHVGSDGGTVYPFFKIRKEQFVRPILSAAEVAWQYATEGKDAAQQLKFALDGANPLSLSQLYPPAAKAALSYFYNTDIFRKQPVWKGKQDIEPYAEYTLNTNPILTAIGKVTAYKGDDGQLKGGISPERLGSAMGNIVTPSNFFVQIGSNSLTDLYEKMSPTDKVAFSKTAYEKWKTTPGLSRVLGLARDTEQFREGIREARTGTATQQFETNKVLDGMVLRYIKGGMQDPALYQRIADYVAQQPPAVQDRLNGRIDDLAETANLPDRGWWLSVKALQPEDRAIQFKARMQKASPEEQQRMLQIADGLTGFVSDRFIEQFNTP